MAAQRCMIFQNLVLKLLVNHYNHARVQLESKMVSLTHYQRQFGQM